MRFHLKIFYTIVVLLNSFVIGYANFFEPFFGLEDMMNKEKDFLNTDILKNFAPCTEAIKKMGFGDLSCTINCIFDGNQQVKCSLVIIFYRFGVAPDHPEVKNVINTFSKTAENTRFRFLGNISLGSDLTLNELRTKYHAVLLTYGAEKDQKLGILNENAKHVISARDFVGWYNGLPGAENLKPNLNGKNCVIIGQGNVAVDVARILLSPIDELKKTDITDFALETLSNSNIEKVFLIGRRGPLQAAFTIKELREMLKLKNVDTIWRQRDFEGLREEIGNLPRPRKRLTELMISSMDDSKLMAVNKQFLPVFFRSPKIIKENSVEFIVNILENNRSIPTKEIEEFPCDIVFRSIGYKSLCADDNLCFDETNGYVMNENGRVLKNDTVGEIDNGLYVAGWLGTGPTGVILTTMNGAFNVAKVICDDINSGKLNCSESKSTLNLENKPIVTWDGWTKINKYEVETGKSKGKPREKVIDIRKMLDIALS